MFFGAAAAAATMKGLGGESSQAGEAFALSFALIGSCGTYLYEIIDVTLAAKRYNEKLRRYHEQHGFYIQPLAWEGEYQLNVGYRF